MSKRFSIAAGQRVKVFRLFSSSIPSTINFEVQAEGEVSGTVEVDRWYWFNWQKETLPLQPHNAIEKRFGDGDFIIHVTPDQNCEVIFGRKKYGGPLLLIALLASVIILIAMAMFMQTQPPPQ